MTTIAVFRDERTGDRVLLTFWNDVLDLRTDDVAAAMEVATRGSDDRRWRAPLELVDQQPPPRRNRRPGPQPLPEDQPLPGLEDAR